MKKTEKQAEEMYKKAIIFNDRGDYGLAEEAFLKALVLYTKLQDWEKVVACEISLGNVCCNKNHIEDTLEHWMSALKIYEQSNLFAEAGNLCMVIGDLFYEQKNLWGSGHYYDKARGNFAKDVVGNELSLAFASQKLGNVFYQIGQTDQAQKCYNDAVPILKRHSLLSNVSDAYVALGHIHYGRSAELELAKINFQLALEIYKELNQESKIEELSNILERISSEEKQKKLEQKVKQLERIVKPATKEVTRDRESLGYSESDFSEFENENRSKHTRVPISYSAAKFVPTVHGVAPVKSLIRSPTQRKHLTNMLANITNEMNSLEVTRANKIKF